MSDIRVVVTVSPKGLRHTLNLQPTTKHPEESVLTIQFNLLSFCSIALNIKDSELGVQLIPSKNSQPT